ncbi:ribonuclease H-like domain-containing protein, partial [Schizophyllum fasciatum]
MRREATELDLLLADVLVRTEGHVDGLRALYGPCSGTLDHPVRVWIDGSCLNNGCDRAQAGAGAFFGENSGRNAKARVPGAQTNNRGEHLAAILALLAVRRSTPLIIYADSELIIHSYCHWARKFEQDGWTCANSDLVQYAVALLQRRSAPVSFRWVKGHSGDKGNDGADRLAKEGA